MAKKFLSTGEEVLETRTRQRDRRIKEGWIKVRLRLINGQVVDKEMSVEDYRKLHVLHQK